MKTRSIACVSSLLALVVGCASSTPPQELLNARTAYDKASHGPAAALAPADLENARQALAVAEKSEKEDPSAPKTRDLSYVAERRSLQAMAIGRAMEDQKAHADADAAFKQTRDQQLTQTQAALTEQTQKTAAEQAARMSAEARARDAVQKLSQLASIKEDTRGTMITLSGSVLFASNKSDLLPDARERLNQVANVLKEQPDMSFTVIGHTDSQGNDEFNRALSQRRADSVRDYLVSRGVDSSHVRSVGRGKDEPIADNGTAEGRANNRRVEILLSSKGFESDARDTPASTRQTSSATGKSTGGTGTTKAP